MDTEPQYLRATRHFTATQKGQVSIMVDAEFELLSDTHWYWWFVRTLNGGEEGFIPAEIVELPRERLARLNRNINIMLSPEPLTLDRVTKLSPKKKVRFNDPILSYSSDEEEDDEDESLPISPLSSDDSDFDSSLENTLNSINLDDGKHTVEHVRIQGSPTEDMSSRLMARAL